MYRICAHASALMPLCSWLSAHASVLLPVCVNWITEAINFELTLGSLANLSPAFICGDRQIVSLEQDLFPLLLSPRMHVRGGEPKKQVFFVGN